MSKGITTIRGETNKDIEVTCPPKIDPGIILVFGQ
jgi:hypothetical protein